MVGGWKMACVVLAIAGVASACRAGEVQPPRPDFHATMIQPGPTTARVPGVLVLGGAEGGDKWALAVAARLADHGYAALAEAYFASPGLDDQLQEIPVERLRQGIDRLVADPRVDPRRIAVLGFSKGAEAALLLASSDARIIAVVAGSPTDVVWQGIDRKAGTVRSSWTSASRPLAFVPFAACADCRSLGALYVKSHEAAGAVAAAVIPVEQVRGPILLLASSSDAVWPSEAMAEALESRLKSRRFRHQITVLRYPDGGHFTMGPLAPEEAAADAGFGGGTTAGVVAARQDSWPRIVSFLDKALRRRD